MTWIANLLQDCRYAGRSLTKNPGFTLIASLTLALGLALATVQFSLIKALFLPEMQIEGADRVMAVALMDDRGAWFDYPKGSVFLGMREHQRSFSSLAGLASIEGRISGEGLDARIYRGAAITSGFFETLGVRPALGRTIQAEDEAPGAGRAVWLAHKTWLGDFGGDRAVVGRVVRFNGEAARIAGVMPERFGFPNNQQIWANMRTDEMRRDELKPFGRLRDKATAALVQAELNVLAPRLAELGVIDDKQFNRLALRPLMGRTKLAVMMLGMLGIVAGVLALACVNVANMGFARAMRQGRELAVRAALGASRWRIVRQMLAESTMLAALGAMGGLAFGAWGIALLRRRIMLDSTLPYWLELDMDWRVFGSTCTLTLLAGLVSGLAPALRASLAQPSAMLKATGGGLAGLRLGWMSRSLVTVQIGLACVLLVVTGLLVDGIRRLGQDESGPRDTTLVARVMLDERLPQYADGASQRLFAGELLAQVRALPGVQAATVTLREPLSESRLSHVEAEKRAETADDASFESNQETVASGYFRDMGIALRLGREFNETDVVGGELAAVVNESFARRTWPDDSPLGKRFREAGSKDGNAPWLTVVGVAEDVRMSGVLSAVDVPRGYYLPTSQAGMSRFYLLARAAGDPHAIAGPIQALARRLAPDVPIDVFKTIRELSAEELSAPRAFSALAFSFGAGALLLAAVGIFSVTAFSVERRSREFGVRMALGARRGDVVGLVFRQSAWHLGIGLGGGFAVGGAIAFALLRSMNGLLPAATAVPYGTIAAAVVLSMAVALLVPARRAARVDPMAALRAE